MQYLPDELRLVIAIAVNVFVFVAAFRFSRRFTSQDRIGAALDALLIHYLVQYLSVCIPGLLEMLRAETMLISATVLAALIFWFARDRQIAGPTDATKTDSLIFSACLLFALGYFCGAIYTQSSGPLVGDDALTYHLPAAGQWMQTGRTGLYNTWFFNPANTYSPLAGSTFLVWLIAPIGCDQIAEFVQMPALILIFLAIVQITRALGVRLSVASLAAVGALLSRPFISEAILIKDDHFIAAFFLASVAGLMPERMKDRLGPWRIGVALGLFFATKYTALLTAPLLLLAIDAPFRAGWRWRHWLIFAACVFAIAGPWYLRNWVLAGNPLYPVPVRVGGLEIFKGMFIPERSTEMRTLQGAWHALTGGFHSPSPTLVVTLGMTWLGVTALVLDRAGREPMIRLILIGPLLGLLIFFFTSHAALIRYAYPSLLLLYICVAIFAGRLTIPIWGQLLLVSVVTAISIWGGFADKELLRDFLIAGAIVCALGMCVVLLLVPLMRTPRVRLAVWSVVLFFVGCAIFIQWHAILLGSRQVSMIALATPYPDQVPMWRYIDEHVPPDAPLAYTNLIFTRPLMGFDYSRRVLYLPTRPGVRNYHDLPSGRERVTDQEIRAFVAKLLTENPDQKMWLEKVLKSDAQFLFIGRQSVLPEPPERAFAESHREHFLRVHEEASGTLYQIQR